VLIPHRRPPEVLSFATEDEFMAEVARRAVERTGVDAVRVLAFRGEQLPVEVTPVRRVVVGGREVVVATGGASAGWMGVPPADEPR
jgi:hypothetical protein